MSDRVRAAGGFVLGLVIFGMAVAVFTVNRADFESIGCGIRLLAQGHTPWAQGVPCGDGFFNPPFSVVFLWPMLFTSPRFMLVLGAALVCAFIFYQRAWVALSFFLTNSALYLIAAGGVDLYLIGLGLLLLTAGDRLYSRRVGLALRVLAYGALMVKPQGTLFIVGLYVLLRRDWKGVLASALVYGLPFISLYPGWVHTLLYSPPLSQTVGAHTILKKFGPAVAGLVALGVLASGRWKYWQLGGALAGILSPYGMPGVPILLTLGAASRLSAFPVVVVYSACLAAATWVTPPPAWSGEFYEYVLPYMSLYHVGMLALALVLAVYARSPAAESDPGGESFLARTLVADYFRRAGHLLRRGQPGAAQPGPVPGEPAPGEVRP